MTKEESSSLNLGDRIKHSITGEELAVISGTEKLIVAVQTIPLSDASQWELVPKVIPLQQGPGVKPKDHHA